MPPTFLFLLSSLVKEQTVKLFKKLNTSLENVNITTFGARNA